MTVNSTALNNINEKNEYSQSINSHEYSSSKKQTFKCLKKYL